MAPTSGDRQVATGTVLFTLACGQFLMTLDSSVMNVSIATVAEDVGTTVTGIQTAITMYTLVMAALMITGGKIGQIISFKRSFAIGCVIYGVGSLTTALAPDLTVLLIGWSLLEGIGAALILPAIVALVATNFGRSERPRAYGLVAAFGAIAVAVGPLIGGLLTTYASWRWVFAGEVVVVLGILLLTRRMRGLPPDRATRLDLGGTALSGLGLVLVVFGVLRGGTWGFLNPKPGGPAWLGLSPVFWLVIAGGLVLRWFLSRERARRRRGQPVLLDPGLLDNRLLRGGLNSFLFQYLLQAGLFFTVPLYLSVALGLSAIDTGLRILPLSLTLLLAAVGVPRFFPDASPRRVVQLGFAALFAGIVALAAALNAEAGPEIVTLPLLLAGLGIGALASQLGSVTVSAVPDERSAEVGGLQNTVTNLGASIGTALAGAVLIAGLTTSFLTGIQANPAIPADLSAQAQVQLAAGVPFLSNEQLAAALSDAGVDQATATAAIEQNEQSRLDGLRAALGLLALIALAALFLTRGIPVHQPGTPEPAPPPRT
ncbi:MFS transporter [Catellatospora coxensis]|uniref:MFS transporter n=1 Tax=Catellatospora coxensis TaxID=310354 RepID=A0A8J3L7Z2_9ACTN|nr:MFS transporter [Catellatospora coxensis]GIG09580.1 MFS transporter [Catellatospora coxensis]